MSTTSFLKRLRPRSFPQWRALPILGPLLDDFLQWMHDQNYSVGTIRGYLQVLPKVVGWLHRHRIKTLDQLTHQELRLAHDYFRPKRQAPVGLSVR